MLMFWYIKPFIYAYLCLPLSTYLPIYKFKKIIPYSLCLIAFYFVIVLDSQKRYEDSAEFPCSPHPTSPIANILTLLYLVAQSCLTLCNPWIVAHQPPLSMGILQARILEWVAMPSSIFYISMVLMATRSSVLAWRIPGAWWAAVYGVTQSRTWLKRLSSSSNSSKVTSMDQHQYIVKNQCQYWYIIPNWSLCFIQISFILPNIILLFQILPRIFHAHTAFHSLFRSDSEIGHSAF